MQRTYDGRRLRHRRLLRSAALAQLPADAARELSSYVACAAGADHPLTYLDLRTAGEIDEGGEPTALIEQGWTWERVRFRTRAPGDEGRRRKNNYSATWTTCRATSKPSGA